MCWWFVVPQKRNGYPHVALFHTAINLSRKKFANFRILQKNVNPKQKNPVKYGVF